MNLLAEWVAAAGLGEEVRDALVTWLAKQAASDQFARLEQGSLQEGGVPLRKVFVDLPIARQPFDEPDAERRKFLATLFADKPLSLSGESGGLEAEEPGDMPAPGEHVVRPRHGYVVIGGPGQGKSTLGQLACQIHRAALLAPFVDALTNVQRDVVRSFLDEATKTEIGWPAEVMFPLRVELPRAAPWLAEHGAEALGAPALLRLLSADAQKRSVDIPARALGMLLAYAPCLLVLDGLDEVGAAEDRALLVDAVRELLSALPLSRGLVVATTRPQGYAGELERIGVPLATVHLAPLNEEEALAYGDKLASTKFAAQPDDRDRVMAGLREAAQDPSTERLLTTPLQVTIVVALVQRMGRPPSERWALFKSYFETIYVREVERGTYAASLLREHKMHVTRIHARVGLLLQVESEQAGGTDARLSRERLESIADAVLKEDGIEVEDRALLVRRIVRAAEERLVFLVEPEPGRFGFEIRSLQEFMAAWALADDHDELTEARLLQVAGAPMFRAVTLLLASKFFTEGSPLRGALADRICGALDEQDTASKRTRTGALLALEILEEGSCLNQPAYVKQLMTRACELLDLPPCAEQARLAWIGSSDASKVLRERVAERLTDPNTEGALGAWVALLSPVVPRAL